MAFSRNGAKLEIKLKDDELGFDVNKITSYGLGINGVNNHIQHLNG